MRFRLTLAVLFTALLLPGGAAAATPSLTDTLSPSRTSVEVTSLPEGTTDIHVAVMQSLSGAGVKYLDIPASQTSYTPPAGDPVVDLIAFNSSYRPIGSWAGRKQTVPGEEGTKKEEELPPPPPTITVGVDTGSWPGSLQSDFIAGGINEFRVHQSAASSAVPGHIASIVFGEGGSVSSINAQSFASEVASYAAKYHPLAVEVLNEPGNPFFWGSGAQRNQPAYANLLEAVSRALKGLSQPPVELASFDGGYEGDNYGRTLIKDDPNLLKLGLGWTVHPYGGHTSTSAQGNRARVTEAHAATNQNVYVTEIGWPTAVGQPPTGDSYQWTEAQQAANIKSFVLWARSLGYVSMVTYFNGVDYGSNNWYGLETSSRRHKLGFTALAEASR